MNTRNLIIVGLAILVLAGGGAAWYVFGAGTAETSVDVADLVDDLDGDTAGDDVAAEEDADTDADAAAGDAEEGAEEPATDGEVAETVFSVDQTASTVSYTIFEVLRGQDTDVVGTTSEVAANLAIDPSAGSVDLSTVAVNARTLATDIGSRDNAVRGRILRTDDPANEVITFTPTSIGAVPDDITGPFDVEVTGDLYISGTTVEQTWPLTITPEGDGYRVTGTTTVLRSDYGLQIPSVPSVADVADEVDLAIDLVLVPA